MHARSKHPVLHLVLTAAVASCATGTGSTTARGGPSLLTADELATVEVSNAYEAVQQLRPRWLNPRDDRDPTRVVVNGALRGEISELRQIQFSTVREMRYLDGREATTRFGVGYGGGAIVVRTR